MNSQSINILLVAAMVLFGVSGCTAETVVNNQAEYRSVVKGLGPGDTVVLANGEWKDFEILFKGVGTEKQPITLKAQTKGKVIISGQSNLRLAGEHLIVSGLVFKQGHTPTSSVISFRKSKKELANYSRVTEVVIDNFSNPERYESDYWVAMYGRNNRFDHNHLEGKRNKGVTFAVRMDSEGSRENHHLIDHNYFGPRPILGSNGGETLRIGTSHYSLSDSFTRVENNYFDRCDGELEIISVKSGGNKVTGNVFFESRGTLTMRHGDGNIIEDNVFFGNGVDHTGGIRVINKNQVIRNNYMEGLSGYRFGGALVVMNGVPNSPINRYHQVDNALIENNSIINSDHIQLAAGSDQERSAKPVNSRFKNNLIVSKAEHDIFTVYDDVSGIAFDNNVIDADSDFADKQKFTRAKVTLEKSDNGLLLAPDLAAQGIGVSTDLSPIKKSETGVSWYPKSEAAERFDTGLEIKIAPTEGALVSALGRAAPGDRIVLAPGHYQVAKTLPIDNPVSISAEKAPVNGAPTVKISFERSALFEIVAKGSLKLDGVHISGEDSPDSTGNTVIRTSRYSMQDNYELEINNSVISDLVSNHSFNVLRVYKSTLADRITISDSRFENISGTVLALDQESDDDGKYNAEYITINRSEFNKVESGLVNVYRGGTDESTFGPHFSLSDSSVKNSGFSKRNKSKALIGLHGVQYSIINGNQFESSQVIRINHTVGEPRTWVENNQFINTPMPKVVELNSAKTNTAVFQGNSSETVKGDGHE
jgi:poly(beta-D-mannuronate) lyase